MWNYTAECTWNIEGGGGGEGGRGRYFFMKLKKYIEAKIII